MTETHFTPGPWLLCAHLSSPQGDIDCRCGYRGGIWSGDGELLVCEMGTDPHHEGWEMTPVASRAAQLKDAALIAAAPDLYAALEDAQTFINIMVDRGYVKRTEGLTSIDTALKKARGES